MTEERTKPAPHLHVTIRLDLVNLPDEPRRGRIGPGKIALLEAVSETGSIAAAARRLGLSYRRAWRMIDEMNRLFASPIIQAGSGGPNGGGAHVTEIGRALAQDYRRIEASACGDAESRLAWLHDAIDSSGGAG